MKKLYSACLSFGLAAFTFQAFSQSNMVLHINGEEPTPTADITGTHNVTVTGNVTAVNGEIIMPTGDDYLGISQFVAGFDITGPWTASFRCYLTNNLDSVYFIDWRSNNSTGHMHIAYKHYKGVYFSDRAINGIEGQLIADSLIIAPNTWVEIKVTHQNNHFTIYRDNVITKEADYLGTLSPTSTTTFGYS